MGWRDAVTDVSTSALVIHERLEAIATRSEAIASRLEAIASRLGAVAIRLEDLGFRVISWKLGSQWTPDLWDHDPVEST